MTKKKVVHVIDDLGRGGAETMLVDLLRNLSEEYELTLVTLRPKIEFEPEQVICKEHISLNYYGAKDLFAAANTLKAIIKRVQPDLVRCQLYWSTIIGRMACPRSIPLFFSVHATMNEDPIAFYKRYFLYLLERLTYRKYQNMIGVTQAVVDSFIKVHPDHGRTYLLHNFVRDAFFAVAYEPSFARGKPLRLVTVSNLRLIKNIGYLIEAMRLMQDKDVWLDIYGDGPLKADLEDSIRRYGLKNVRLMGKRTDIYSVLPQYDVFISPSTVEGFGIAVAEAMSVGLPVIISDIPVYREICKDKAIYLDNKAPSSLTTIIQSILEGATSLQKLSADNREYAQKMFSKQGYLLKLKEIYDKAAEK